MSNRQSTSTLSAPHCSRKAPGRDHQPRPAVSAEQVKGMLLEVAYTLHATRVVGWQGGAVAPKKG